MSRVSPPDDPIGSQSEATFIRPNWPATTGVLLRLLVGAALILLGGAPLFAQQTATVAGSGTASGGAVKGALVRNVTISWAAVEGATGYRVLVRPLGGDVTLDRRTASTKLHVVLTPGTYQVRVVSFNIFDKPASVSPWHDIDVIRVYKPVVKLLSPKVLYRGRAAVRETVDGLHFLPETTAALTRDGQVVAKGTIDRVRDDQLKMHFDLRAVKSGKYDLRLSNPEHLVLVMRNAIDVRPRIQPRLDSISVRTGYNDRAYRDVTVRGSGFLPGTTFFLERQGHRIAISNFTLHSAKKVSVDLNLGSAVPGSYDLVATNPGGKIVRLPRAVRVLNITTPVFESVKPAVFTIGESSGYFLLRAKDMIPSVQVYLRKNGQLIPTVALGSSAPSSEIGPSPNAPRPFGGGAGSVGERHFRIEFSAVGPGRYDLVIANSLLNRTVVAGAVTIRPKPIPRLTGASVTQAYDTLAYKGIVLRGKNLKPSFGVSLKRGKVERELPSRFISPTRMSVDIDFRGMTPGTYRVLVQSSGRVVASLPGGIRVTTPRPRFIHPSAPVLLLGYPYALVLSQSFANSVSISTIGGRLFADLPLGVKFFPKVPGLRDMGVALQAGYSYYDRAAAGTAAGTTSTLGMTRPGIDLYYRTPFNFPLNGFVAVGYGLALTGFHSTSKTSTASGSALDFYYRVGAGGELDLGKRFVFQAGADWVRVLYAVTNLDTLGFYLRGGIRFAK